MWVHLEYPYLFSDQHTYVPSVPTDTTLVASCIGDLVKTKLHRMADGLPFADIHTAPKGATSCCQVLLQG